MAFGDAASALNAFILVDFIPEGDGLEEHHLQLGLGVDIDHPVSPGGFAAGREVREGIAGM